MKFNTPVTFFPGSCRNSLKNMGWQEIHQTNPVWEECSNSTCCFCGHNEPLKQPDFIFIKNKPVRQPTRPFGMLLHSYKREQGGPFLSPQLYPHVLEKNLMICLSIKWCLSPIYPGLSALTLICLEIGWFRSSHVYRGASYITLSLFTDQFMLYSREIIKNYILRAYTWKRLNLGKITVSYMHSIAWVVERGQVALQSWMEIGS